MTDWTRRYWLRFKHRICFRIRCAVRGRHNWRLGMAIGKHGEFFDSHCGDCGVWGTYPPHKALLDELFMTERTMPAPGPEMDALVARLGWPDEWPLGPRWAPFSTSSTDAMWALEAWREQHPTACEVVIRMWGGEVMVSLWWEGGAFHGTAKSPTLAQAICEAIIRAQWAVEDAE